MTGMEMMLKAMGIDAKEITESVGNLGKLIADMHARETRIEAKLDRLLAVHDIDPSAIITALNPEPVTSETAK